MDLIQESTGTVHCYKAQCRTRYTASLETLAYSSDRVLCCTSCNASVPQCSTCLQTPVCENQEQRAFSEYGRRHSSNFLCDVVPVKRLTWGCYILALLTVLQFHRSWSSGTRWSTVPSLHSLSLGVYPQSRIPLRYTTEEESQLCFAMSKIIFVPFSVQILVMEWLA